MSWTISLNGDALKASYSPSQIYWAVIARIPQGGPFHYLNANNEWVVMTETDNNTPVGTLDNCVCGQTHSNKFANFFVTLDEVSEFIIEDDAILDSARVHVALGDWLPICVNSVNGNGQGIGYAPPSVTNPSLQGYNTKADIVEFAYNVAGVKKLNCNTSSVDALQFPIELTVSPAQSSGPSTVGYSSTRSAIFTAFNNCKDTNFASLIIGNDLRILAPGHACEGNGYIPPAQIGIPQGVVNYFTTFYDSYVTTCWTHYNTHDLTIYITGIAYTGRVNAGGDFVFSPGTSFDAGNIVCTITKPESWEIFLAAGQFKQGTVTAQNIKKFFVSALYRTVLMETPTDTFNSWESDALVAKYYTNAPINYYGKILHENSMKGTVEEKAGVTHDFYLCYAFGFDDVDQQSPSMVSQNPTSMELVLPAWS